MPAQVMTIAATSPRVRCLGVLLGAIAGVALAPTPSWAETIEYTPDGVRDGVTDGIPGDWALPGFEIFGTGYGQQGNSLIVGISSHFPFGGYAAPGSGGRSGHVNWGDLFLNFSDDDFETALAKGNVYGVRFDPNNDSGVSTGVYQVTATQSVTGINGGFSSINDYAKRVTDFGYTPYLGEMVIDSNFTYLDPTKSDNVIASGTLLSTDVEYIADLSALGFEQDFGFSDNLPETGAYTYGFRFDLSNLPLGQFIAHLWAECINDGVAFVGQVRTENSQSVPEPSVLIGLGLMGAVLWRQRQRLG